ncbi:MAG TPA: YkgJ family cysteine cluster protein [Stenotrophomonas sp.]|nr:YkgJ family cysteine cluster protein [Stenotrophomonas sp.]
MRDCLDCRDGCGACCVAPSITSPLPGMPQGKPAGVACVQLDENMRCRVFGRAERPGFCASLRPAADMCGGSRGEALALLTAMELATRP